MSPVNNESDGYNPRTTGQGGLLGLDLKTIVTLATLAAAFVGQWYVMGNNVERQNSDIRELRMAIEAMAYRMNMVERDVAVGKVRQENLVDAVTALQRR